MSIFRNGLKQINASLKKQGKMIARRVIQVLCATLFWLMELEYCFSHQTGLTTDDFTEDADLLTSLVCGAMDKNRPSAFFA